MNESDFQQLFEANTKLRAAIEQVARLYFFLSIADFHDEDDMDYTFFEIEDIPNWGPDYELWAPRVRVMAWRHSKDYEEKWTLRFPIAYLWDTEWQERLRKIKEARLTR